MSNDTDEPDRVTERQQMKKYSVLYVKIYGDKSVVEDADGRELKSGTLDQHAENVRWAGERAEKVDYDS